MKNLYTIGEVATIFNETTETFRHYDRVNLLKAHVVKDNGYRYYSLDQFEMIRTILYLRSIGTSINRIKEILNSKHRESITSELKIQRESLNKQIEELKQLDFQASSLLKQLDEFNSTAIHTETCPDFYIIDQSFSSEELSLETERIKILRQGIDNSWVQYSSIISIIDKENLVSGLYHTYVKYGLISEEPLDTTSPFFSHIPSQQYVVSCIKIETFDHFEVDKLYPKMIDYINENQLLISGDIFERNILDLYNEQGNGDIHYIKIYIPVVPL